MRVGMGVAACQIPRHRTFRKDQLMATQYASTAATVRAATLSHTYVVGGGGARLHVVETGNPEGRPILLIHGFSQAWLTWRRQLFSNLGNDYRLVALDLRGHGQSDKPKD